MLLLDSTSPEGSYTCVGYTAAGNELSRVQKALRQ